MELIKKKRNTKKASRSNSVEYRRDVVGSGNYDMHLLQQCYRLWMNLAEARQRRARGFRMVYGDQWSDLIDVKGKVMTQREYITSVGNVALQTNQLKKIVTTISGTYVKQQNEPSCRARAREEQIFGEVMSETMKANWQLNDMPLVLDDRIIEALVGGFTFVRENYDHFEGEEDSWSYTPHANYMFFDSAMKDPRYRDWELIGEIHDLSFGTFCEKFARSREDIEKFSQWYNNASSPLTVKNMEDINDKHEEELLTFWTPRDKTKCRVYEVWTKETKDRYRVHDENTGELYMIDADDHESISHIEAENKERLTLARQQGWAADEVPLIRYRENFFVDSYWYCRFLTPQGYILWEGPSPYSERRHPYAILILPMVDGKITSYLSDAIDQNIAINRLLTLHDWMMRAGLKGVTFVPKDIVPDDMNEEDFAEQLTTIDGVVFYEPTASGHKPETFYGHTGTLNLAEIVKMMSDLMESSVSVNAALRGEGVKSGTAAALYAQQAENSATPIASLMMRFGVFVKHIARLKLANIQKFYPPEKYEEIAGQLSHLANMSSKDFKLAGNIEYDLSIAQSMATPIYRALKTDILMQFADRGFIPPRIVLECGEIPGADEILQKLDAMAQENADQPIGDDYQQKMQMMQQIQTV